MEYKYKKGQIFGKRLKVPKSILERVYSNNLTLEEFITYKLEDKIPISCIRIKDRELVEKFGIKACKKLDFDLINNAYFNRVFNFRELLLSIDSSSQDLNYELYKRIINEISPNDYTAQMKQIFKDRYFEVGPITDLDDPYRKLKFMYNQGWVDLTRIVLNWKIFENMNLDYCLKHDHNNDHHLNNNQVKEFMEEYGNISSLIIRHGNIYEFINDLYNSDTTQEQKEEYIKSFAEQILEKTIRTSDNMNPINLEEEEYRELFKYASLEKYLGNFDKHSVHVIFEELKMLPEDYIFNIPFPIKTLMNYHVLEFIREFGLKNIVDFDNESGHFFSNDNCKMLKLMFETYMHYAGNEHDQNKNIYAPSSYTRYDSSGKYLGRGYTKDDFYESMRRMIIYRVSSNGPDYREMTGEFRERNKRLYISEQAPEELQSMFYTKSITPSMLVEHPEYIPYLKGKELSSCFKNRSIRVAGSPSLYGYENLYSFLSSKMQYEKVISFITEYSDILDTIYDSNITYSSNYEIKVSINDDIDRLTEVINDLFKQLIIKKGCAYPSNIPHKLIERFPSMFLRPEAPQELQDAFYNRTINSAFILSIPNYKEYLKDIDLGLLYGYIPINVSKEMYEYNEDNLINLIENIFGKEDALDLLLIYSKYIEATFKINRFSTFDYKEINSKDDLLDQIDKCIYKAITYGSMIYDENVPSHFKNNYPTLFLNKNLPQEIRNKFYNREFTVNDFNLNKELLEMCGETNIICGFSKNESWLIPLFNELDDQVFANKIRLKLVEEYSKVKNTTMGEIFKKYVVDHSHEINIDKIECLSEVLTRLEYSNSNEMYSFRENLANKLLNTDNPISNLEKIEKVFLQNNLPLCGKMFLCFEILYPDLDKNMNFSFGENSRIAPELKDETLHDIGINLSQNDKRMILIFNDLLRIAYRSNERSFMEYLNNIEAGNDIYIDLQNSNYDLSKLSKQQVAVLEEFINHLIVLYQNTQKGKDERMDFSNTTLEEKVKILGENFKPNNRYDLKDRIVRSFCYMAGIKSFDELKALTLQAKQDQEKRKNEFMKTMAENGGIFKFEEGDFVRGIGYYETLGSTLSAGNVCKEHLGVFSGTSTSDTTPLDVDLTLITNPDDIYHTIKGTPTGFAFGNIYVIFKKDNPSLNITRDKDGNLTGNEYNPRKIETFGTLTKGGGYETHWGARTGFAFTDVDCILYKANKKIDDETPYDENGNIRYESTSETIYDDLPAIKFEIAKNGYYIPVVDFSGKLIFTEEEFKELRDKMQGLSFYGEKQYKLSENLINPEVEKVASTLTNESKKQTEKKRKKINDIIKQVLVEFGYDIKFEMDGDLTAGTIEFIDTGSTGRNTNVPQAGDFDFYMRLDADIIRNPEKLTKFKSKIVEEITKFPTEETPAVTNAGDLRFKGVNIDEQTIVDIDISFGTKTNKVRYSSDECLKDRLTTIYEQHPEQYKYIVANIILAKNIMKEAGAYKPQRSDATQGGLGGIGIENWILQHGGSFEDAAASFLEASEGKTFAEFKESYRIWDFGENHFAARKGHYVHDNFVANNMSEEGYHKMRNALNSYFKQKEVSAMLETRTEQISPSESKK